MKLAIQSWSGSVVKLANEVIKPQLISPASMLAWNEFITKKIDSSHINFVLSAPSPDMRSKIGAEKLYYTKADQKVVFSDQAAPIAILSYLAETNAQSPEKLASLYLQLPLHVFDLDKFTRWAGFQNNLTSAGWIIYFFNQKVLDTTKWDSYSHEQLKKQMLLLLSPYNFFVLPAFQKSGVLLAADNRFQAIMYEIYKDQYGEPFVEFHKNAGSTHLVETPPADFEFEFASSSKSTATKGATTAGMQTSAVSESKNLPPKPTKDLIIKIEPKDAYELKLVTVSEIQNSHSRHIDLGSIVNGLYDIKLDYKSKGGDVHTVGFYRLNINELFSKKYVTQDTEGLKISFYFDPETKVFSIGKRRTSEQAPFPKST